MTQDDEVWKPTMHLRWEVPKFAAASFEPILKQLWLSNHGSEEWRSINEVESP